MSYTQKLDLVRISAPYSNKLVKTALIYRSRILKQSIRDGASVAQSEESSPYGKEVKMVRCHTLSPRLLTPNEKDEVATKYESGMTMTAIADFYSCHYTTVGRILRKRGIAIRG